MKLKKEVKIILAVILLCIIGFIGVKAMGGRNTEEAKTPVSEATAVTETTAEETAETEQTEETEQITEEEQQIIEELESAAPEIYVPEGTIEPMEPQSDGDITIEEGQHGSF